ncbi:unnamed protein product [Trichogramma brassicae]|uniref:Uncharacterized protein n=1 Tax=Trichogramma brassicae TaxID=86971 RepID=A0A6H5ITE7_9HYME|nr:unnamed protein product [Trichogramma brassicae]
MDVCAIYNTCPTRPRAAAAATTPESDERDNIGEQLYTIILCVYLYIGPWKPSVEFGAMRGRNRHRVAPTRALATLKLPLISRD